MQVLTSPSLSVTMISSGVWQNIGFFFHASIIPTTATYLLHSNNGAGVLSLSPSIQIALHNKDMGGYYYYYKVARGDNSFVFYDTQMLTFNTYDYKMDAWIRKDEYNPAWAPTTRKYSTGDYLNWVTFQTLDISTPTTTAVIYKKALGATTPFTSGSCGASNPENLLNWEYDPGLNSDRIFAIGTSEESHFDAVANATVYGNFYGIYQLNRATGACAFASFLTESDTLPYRMNYVLKVFNCSDSVFRAARMTVSGSSLVISVWAISPGTLSMAMATTRTITYNQAPPTIAMLNDMIYITKYNLFYFKWTQTIFLYNWTQPANKQFTIFVESDFVLGPSVVTSMSDGTSYMFFPSPNNGEFLALNLGTRNFEIIDKAGLEDVFLLPVMDSDSTDKIKVYTKGGGFFEVYKQDHRCLVCDATCRTCFGELNTQCLSCFGNYTVSPTSGKCIITCAADQYAVDNLYCYPCHSNCATCKAGTQYDCLSCKTLEFTLIRGTCLKNCPSTQYFDLTTLLCTDCNPRCLSCTGPGEYACTACKAGFTLEDNGYCTRICPMGQYLDAPVDTCKVCVSACSSCFGGSVFNCTSCNSAWSFIPSKNYCQPSCIRGQYIDGADCSPCVNPCVSCTNSTFCLDCIVNYQFLGNGVCKCSDIGYYKNANLECLPCNDLCLTCVNGTVSGCTACRSGYLFNPFALPNNPVCVQECPAGTFQNAATVMCAKCDPSCATCSGSTTQSCTSCPASTGLFNGMCYTQCPDRYVLNSTLRACVACPTYCLQCNPNKNDQCLLCDGIFLNQGSCVQKCPLQTYPTTINGVKQCTPCSSGCLICNDKGICTKCRTGGILLGALCVKSCPLGYKLARDIGDPTNMYCDQIKCQDLCEICQDTNLCSKCFNTTADNVTQVVNSIGQCVPCNQTFGLRMVDGKCTELCGDGFLYKIENKPSTHQCDDGNSANGDGCSSTCQIEQDFSCTRQYQLSKESIPIKDYCVEATKKTLTRDTDNPQRFSYNLKFSRPVVLSLDDMQRMYNLVIIDENKKQFIIPQDVINVDPKTFYITVNEKQFRNSLFGSLWIMKKASLTKPPLFKDEVDQDVTIDGLNCTFIYDKNKEGNIQSITGISDKINGFMESGLGQSVLILCSMNPVFFNMMVNVLQKFVYFRVLNMMYPDNIQLFFKIFGSAWSVNLGQTDYDPKAKPSAFDQMLGLTPEDQAIPDRFKAVKLSGLFLKGSLPSLLVLGVTYSVAMITLIIEKKAQKYTVKKLRKKKMLGLIFKINAIARSKMVWSSIIRSNFMSYQNFTFSTFLNLAILSRSKYITMFSSLLAFFGLAFILGNIGFYIFLIRSEKGEGGKFDEKFDIFNGSNDHFIGQYYKIFKFMVKPTLLAVVTCLFYNIPAIPVYSLFVVSVVEQLVIMIKPVYISKKDNFKVIFEGLFMTILTIFPLMFFNMDPKSEKASSLGMTMLGFIFFIILSNLVMGVVMEKKTI